MTLRKALLSGWMNGFLIELSVLAFLWLEILAAIGFLIQSKEGRYLAIVLLVLPGTVVVTWKTIMHRGFGGW